MRMSQISALYRLEAAYALPGHTEIPEIPAEAGTTNRRRYYEQHAAESGTVEVDGI